MRTLLILLLSICLMTNVYGQKLRIAVAANAQFVAEQIKESFEKQTGIKTELIVSSSGKLTAQIKQGAPFDVFLSADMKYPQALFSAGLTTAKPKIYAYGTLVFWTLKNIENLSLQMVQEAGINKIAIANPKTAPYGEAAIQALSKSSLYDKVKHTLVYGESIAQVNQYLLSGAVGMAFTAKSVVLEPAMKGKGKWIEIDKNLYTPIAQGVIILKRATGNTATDAQKFYNFLFTEQSEKIFQTYGYQTP